MIRRKIIFLWELGKYKLKSIDINTQMDLELNTSWWDKEKELKVDSVTVRIYGTIAEMYNAYKLRRSRFNYKPKLEC